MGWTTCRSVELCKARGVSCGEMVDSGPAFGFDVLMFEDPDGIQIELVANHKPPATYRPMAYYF